MSLLEVIWVAVLLAGHSVGLTLVIRSLPFVGRWVENGTKPWACDLCMSFWTTLGLFLALLGTAGSYSLDVPPVWLAAVLPAFVAAYGVLTRIVPEPVYIPDFAPDDDEAPTE